MNMCKGYKSIWMAVFWIAYSYILDARDFVRKVKSQWLVVLLVLPLMASCAIKDQQDTNRILAAELSKQYIGLHEQYISLDDRLPDSQKEELHKLASLFDRAKKHLIDYTDYVIQGQEDTEEAKDTMEVAQEILFYIAEEMAQMALTEWEDKNGTK